ncbi:MAG TPA: uroporphyrinogen-III C-methyltransferase [Solirubrobacteraceae bacterium]|nr:uroporphyrinogen-III C-methyltransferase [Solirubrobacteraceae bacterium]
MNAAPEEPPEGTGQPHAPTDSPEPRVYLVGAGPGDPGLITTRGLELIERAEVILHDRLIPRSLLAVASPAALIIDVGKMPRGPSVSQSDTEALLLEHARAGRLVVRLKGGDPFVFGRGGEEALALSAAGIPFEVVPGVSAGVAAPAYAGIPVTHRDRASAVAFVTAHEDPGKPDSALDFGALAAFPGTLVFYMGVRELPAVVDRLIAAGRSPEEPAAVIERGTFPEQRVVSGRLADIDRIAAAAGIGPPAITVTGPVAALRDQLAWFENRPLAGLTVAVTRARESASVLAQRLRILGASVVEAPAIRMVPLPVEVPDLSAYDLVCLTSPTGVRLLFERLGETGRDARALAGARIAAIGPGTARVLSENGITADILPDRFVAEGLVSALGEIPVRRALIARAREARDVLPAALRERGAEVDVLALYETVAEPLRDEDKAAALAADYITFTSSSTVAYFLAAAGDHRGPEPSEDRPAPEAAGDRRGPEASEDRVPIGPRTVSIGPVTSATLRESGLDVDIEADRHDIDGLVAALLADARAHRE